MLCQQFLPQILNFNAVMTNPSQSNGAYIVGYIENEFTKPSNQICHSKPSFKWHLSEHWDEKMYTYDTNTQVVTNVFGLNKSLLLSIDRD